MCVCVCVCVERERENTHELSVPLHTTLRKWAEVGEVKNGYKNILSFSQVTIKTQMNNMNCSTVKFYLWNTIFSFVLFKDQVFISRMWEAFPPILVHVRASYFCSFELASRSVIWLGQGMNARGILSFRILFILMYLCLKMIYAL